MTDFPTSTIQDFTDALIAHLRERPGLANVLISDGPPPAAYLQVGEWMMFGDVTGGQEWAAISRDRRPKDEIYTIDIYIDVVSATTASDNEVQPVVNRRAIAILAELEQELRNNPTQGVGPDTGINPGGYVIASEIREPLTLQKGGNDTQREAFFHVGVEVKARI